MEGFFNNINQVMGQSGEVSKLKQKELNKKKLEEVASREKFVEKMEVELIHDVDNKDTSIPLVHQAVKMKKHKKNIQSEEESEEKSKKKWMVDEYKGNFLDYKG